MALIEYRRRGHTAEVRLNRPSSLNAINDEMDLALADAWERIDGDPDIRVAILTGAGEKAFCAGGDMSDPPTGHNGLSFGGGMTGIGGRLKPLRKPLICGVHGYVLGLGFELALCADILIASDDAHFCLPEAHVGVIDHCGVVHRAIRQLPHHIALAMIIASEPLDAIAAARYGLVNQCVARADLSHALSEWENKVLACSPLVSQAGKQAALDGLEHSLPTALTRRYPLIESYAQTRDRNEAVQAWDEKRAPRWDGR
ncbi:MULTISPECIES: enoyl-CoA hydratase-related protein [Sphingobium]|uniref:Crotonase n=1 Tax=Sphingobium baderi TaxID=1332080 RepID=A0A0S3F2Z7_9SPHN|nr:MULTISPECIES: enoyl-CoA hydratase-related protein [Sphingobium]ALR22059.1 crotonase [Sphingobium baderi]